MQPETLDTVLMILSWLVIIFGTVWFATGIIGYFHRKSYNLTRAESGGSKPITPDFLKVDQKKRQAAIDRGAAYSEVLDARAAPSSPVAKASNWARAGATATASATLLAAIVGTITRVRVLQEGVEQLSSWDAITALVKEYPAGVIVAVLIIGTNIVIFVKATKKTPATR
jgi:hypothetical protein